LRAREDVVVDVLVDGQRFSGYRRLIDIRRATHHNAVRQDAFARPYDDEVTD
jgi:hypothetical protein